MTLAPDVDSGGRPVWREAWFAPVITTLVLIGVIASLTFTFLDMQREERARVTASELLEGRKSVDFRLRGNLDYLALLGKEWASGALDDESFQRRADAYVADHRELINVTRVGADFVIRGVAPLEGNSQIVGLRLTLPEPARASSEAKRSRRAVYTRPFEAIQGKPSFEVWLPVFRGDEFLGLLAGVYSIEGLLRHVVAPVATGRHLHLLDSSGTVFAETGRHPPSDDAVRATSLSVIGLRLGIWPVVMPVPWLMIVLVAFAFALTAGMGWAIWTQGREIDRRREAEAALRESEEKFRNVTEHSPSAIFLKDLEGRYRLVNRQFEEWYGVTARDVVGKTPHEIFPGRIADSYVARDREVLKTGEVSEQEIENPFADGTMHTLTVTKFPVFGPAGRPIGVGAISTDVTEQRTAEEQLRQAQKMEVIGQLTGGIAHDFNNLLTIVQGNLEIIEPQPGIPPGAKRLIAAALRATQRASDLTRRLLAYARRQPLSPRPTDVNRLVSGMHDLLHRTVLGANIEIDTDLASDLWPAVVDESQLENAILNLALNARDAMPDGGRVRIETANVEFDGTSEGGRRKLSSGEYVMVAVGDTGSGMSDEIRERAFEPFFTTKRAGAGTGLGLSMTYGFVKQSGGHIEISSAPGCGSTVSIYLPRTLSDARTDDTVQIPRAAPSGKESILVVEDDAEVREYVVNMLGLLGYSVIEAGDGPSALALLDNNDTEADLMFTDVVLPGGMSGKDVAEAAQQRRPGLKVLFTSGYPEDIIVHDGRLDEGVDLLHKPYTRERLAGRIRQALAGREG